MSNKRPVSSSTFVAKSEKYEFVQNIISNNMRLACTLLPALQVSRLRKKNSSCCDFTSYPISPNSTNSFYLSSF